MDLELEDRVAFVAGSSRGIGRAIAHTLLEEGAKVVVTGRLPEPLSATFEDFIGRFGSQRVMRFCGDLTRPEEIEDALARTFEEWGGLDVLVANIGSGAGVAGWRHDAKEWDKAFQLNFWSAVRLADAGLPLLVDTGGGSFTIISSIAGVESIDAPLPYTAAKSALLSYSKSLARLIGSERVRVNCVAPGNVLFTGGSWEGKVADRPAWVRSYVEREVALRRFGTPEEISAVVAFLASDRAAFVTGACFVVDGGQTRAW